LGAKRLVTKLTTLEKLDSEISKITSLNGVKRSISFNLVDLQRLAMVGTERIGDLNYGLQVLMKRFGKPILIVSRNWWRIWNAGCGAESVQVHFLGKKSFYDIRAFWKLICGWLNRRKANSFHCSTVHLDLLG